MVVRTGDLLAFGLSGISIWVLTTISNFWVTLGLWFGVIGAVITIYVEIFFIIQTYRRKKK